MTPKEKAIYIINQINGHPITIEEWDKASDYAKNDLKRKAKIVVYEVLKIPYLLKRETYFYNQVIKEIELL